MSYNGSGTFSLVAGNPVVTGTTISTTWANNTLNDIATGLSTAITKDGQTTPTANIPMGGYKITNVGLATTNGDAVPYQQVGILQQAQTFVAFTTGGTSTAYTLTPTPAITAYVAGQSFWVTFNAASGAAPTLAISGVATPPNLVKQIADGTFANIAANDIPINHRSRVTLLSATQALVDLPAAAGKYITALPDLGAAITPAMLTQPLTLATEITASGTSVDFTGIPSWARRITVMLSAISTNGTSVLRFQIGDAGGIENTGYLGAVGQIISGGTDVSAGIGDGLPLIPSTSAGVTLHGHILLTCSDPTTHKWVMSGSLGRSDVAQAMTFGGSKTLSAALDRVRLTTTGGTDTFDNGTVNILYEG